MGYRWQGQTNAAISDSRGGHGLPPLAICEQAHHLRPQSPQWSVQCFCPLSPGNAHILLLPLPNVPGATYSCLRVTATSHGPATRRSLYHLPTGPCHCQEPSNKALANSPAHCLHLPGSNSRPYTSVPHIKGITACTH